MGHSLRIPLLFPLDTTKDSFPSLNVTLELRKSSAIFLCLMIVQDYLLEPSLFRYDMDIHCLPLFLAFAKNKESTVPSMTFSTVFFFRPPSFQPASIIYYVNNVGTALVLLRFAREWPPQHKKR
jgi:hypothetical protein